MPFILAAFWGSKAPEMAGEARSLLDRLDKRRGELGLLQSHRPAGSAAAASGMVHAATWLRTKGSNQLVAGTD